MRGGGGGERGGERGWDQCGGKFQGSRISLEGRMDAKAEEALGDGKKYGVVCVRFGGWN